ncbi:MAG: SMP-30/gluconolactonase/LRE family protein [Anaerolineaceae bacterium]
MSECPVWHPDQKAYYWTDIEGSRLYKHDPVRGYTNFWTLSEQVGSFALTSRKPFLMAAASGLSFFDPEIGLSEQIVQLAIPANGVMMNDGRVDSLGRFWVGSKSSNRTARLYSIDATFTPIVKLENIGISNGIDWSLDDQFCYYTDSADNTIYRYKFDSTSGIIYDREVFFVPQTGTPDGLCVDVKGNIWTALWDGWKLLQLDPDGNILFEVHLPVARPTSLCFGGESYTDLLITSASTGLTNEELAAQPMAGDIFYLPGLCQGRPSNRFIL